MNLKNNFIDENSLGMKILEEDKNEEKICWGCNTFNDIYFSCKICKHYFCEYI